MDLFKLILLIVVISLVIALYSSWTKNKVLLSGFKSGTQEVTVKSSELPYNRSSNNYAYSIWFYVKDWQYRLEQSKYLLERKANESSNPSITLTPYENNINISIATYPTSATESSGNTVDSTTTSSSDNSTIHNCLVNNFPLQKWVNLIVSLNGRALDIYLDGKLVRTCILPGVARISPDADIDITPNGGLNGWTSNLQYWANPLNPQEAYNVYKQGYGQGGLGGIFEKYKIKISYLVNNAEKSSFEIF